MGNSFFCNRCDIEKFQLSRACADQFLNDDNNENQTEEERWRQKLKCLDDVHSKKFGLTEDAFNELLDKLEHNLKKLPVYCRNRDLILACLQHNPNCSLNCKREMDEFIDCVDTIRIRKVKERIQEATKKKANLGSLPT